MDGKEKWQLARITKGIYTDNFSEDDVFILLMLLRRFAPKKSSLREFSDFLAHREKDQGLIFDYMVEVRSAIDRPSPFEETIKIRPVFTIDTLACEINYLLKQVGLEPFTKYQVNHLMVCIISLLQAVEIKTSKGLVGHLQVALNNDEIHLVGQIHLAAYDTDVIFVALSAKNDIFDSPIPVPDGQAFLTLSGVCWARTIHGRFSLNQHETSYTG